MSLCDDVFDLNESPSHHPGLMMPVSSCDDQWCITNSERKPSTQTTARKVNTRGNYSWRKSNNGSWIKPPKPDTDSYSGIKLQDVESTRARSTGIKDVSTLKDCCKVLNFHAPTESANSNVKYQRKNDREDIGEVASMQECLEHLHAPYVKLKSNRRKESLRSRKEQAKQVNICVDTKQILPEYPLPGLRAYSHTPLLRHSSEGVLCKSVLGDVRPYCPMSSTQNTLPWRIIKSNSYSYSHKPYPGIPEIIGSSLVPMDSQSSQLFKFATNRYSRRHTEKRMMTGSISPDKSTRMAAYPDPLVDGPPKYRKRLGELFALVSDTIRGERDSRVLRKDGGLFTNTRATL